MSNILPGAPLTFARARPARAGEMSRAQLRTTIREPLTGRADKAILRCGQLNIDESGATMLQQNKRKETRTAAAVPLYFKDGRGVTDDVSATGVFFWTESPTKFAVGDQISFTLVISDSGTTATSECSGKIVRVLSRHTPKGVAVKLFHPALSRFVE